MKKSSCGRLERALQAHAVDAALVLYGLGSRLSVHGGQVQGCAAMKEMATASHIDSWERSP